MSAQLMLNEYQQVVRRTDPVTSVQAAQVAVKADKRKLVFDIFQTFGPLTDEQAFRYMHGALTPQRARTIRAQLVREMQIVCVGLSKTELGNNCQLWDVKR